MAIFNKKTAVTSATSVSEKAEKETSVVIVATPTASKTPRATGGLDLGHVLLRPHVTEKASDLSEKNIYAFEVNVLANKMQIRQAIEKLFSVKPIKIAIIMEKPKFMKNPRTNRTQVKRHAGKKALVYLKAGDKIEFA